MCRRAAFTRTRVRRPRSRSLPFPPAADGYVDATSLTAFLHTYAVSDIHCDHCPPSCDIFILEHFREQQLKSCGPWMGEERNHLRVDSLH